MSKIDDTLDIGGTRSCLLVGLPEPDAKSEQFFVDWRIVWDQSRTIFDFTKIDGWETKKVIFGAKSVQKIFKR